MDKFDIHQRFVDVLKGELAAITASAKDSFATATSEAHHAEGKYDTFSLESSYLARGQAKRVAELADALELFQLLPLKSLDDTSKVQRGALVRLEADDGETRTVYFGPAAGGEEISVDDETIIVLTSSSPLGAAILGKSTGDTFNLKMGIDTQSYTVTSVQ
ncbi:MAG: transcription elongation GreA/GreB family factor [Candidatus Promineifilaceae bacterium]|jgi:transcription elongation GreA/GreB family factor